MNTIQEIEEGMAEEMLASPYEATKAEYHRLLKIMGNVDGDEIVALVLTALHNVMED